MYNRENAVAYAHKWAYGRNPEFYNFDSLGGDCTNFASQVLSAGGEEQNYNKNGWYYRSLNDRSPSWAGVDELYNFLVNNKSVGPKGKLVPLQELIPGDIIQLGNALQGFYHTLVLVQKENYLVAAHSVDSDHRPLDTYKYEFIRGIHLA